MEKILLFLFLSIFTQVDLILADLGPSEAPPDMRKGAQGFKRYDQGDKFPKDIQNAYCAKFFNSCEVVFKENLITVDDSKGVRRDQIKGVWRNFHTGHLPIIHIEYVNDLGEMKVGRFLFQGNNAADKFWYRINEFVYGR